MARDFLRTGNKGIYHPFQDSSQGRSSSVGTGQVTANSTSSLEALGLGDVYYSLMFA